MRHIAALLALVLASPVAFACRCGNRPTIEDALSRSTLVFVGRVTKLQIDHRAAGLYDGHQAYSEVVVCELSKVRALKGEADKKETVVILTNYGGPACEYPFKIGQEYLVYAEVREGELYTDVCCRTRPLVIWPEDQDWSLPVDRLKKDDAAESEIPSIRRIVGIK